MIRLYLVLLALLTLLFSCNPDEPDLSLEEQKSYPFERIFDERVQPYKEQLSTSVLRLSNSIDQFLDDASLENLQKLRKDIIETKKSAVKYELYDFDSLLLYNFLDRRVIRIDRFEELLSDEDEQWNPGRYKVFNSLEFLLNRSESFQILMNLKNEPKQIQILEQISKHLLLSYEKIGNSSKYDKFVGEDSLNNVDLGQMFLAGNNHLYQRLGTLAFTITCGSNFPDEPRFQLDYMEAPFSKQSLPLLKIYFNEWKTVFYGDFDTQESFGYDDCLVAGGHQELLDSINVIITRCDSQLQELNVLEDDVKSHPEKIDALGDSFLDLKRVMWVDFSPVLNIPFYYADLDCD